MNGGTRHPHIRSTALLVEGYRGQLERGELALTAVGAEIGVSREWVRRICVKLGIQAVWPRHCPKCKGLLKLAEHTNEPQWRWYCNACKPRRKVRISYCAECQQPYTMTGRQRDGYIRNHKHGTKTSRCPECLKKAAARWPRITVACADCGTEVQRAESVYQQHRRESRPGPFCLPCRGKRHIKALKKGVA